MNTRSVLGILLIIALVIPFNTIAEQQFGVNANIAAIQKQAYMDAKNDAKKSTTGIWVFAGCLLHVWAIAGAYVIEPSVPTARLIGKSPEYIAFYTDTYKDEVKQQRVTSAIGGCCLGAVFYASAWVLLIAADGISTLDTLY